MTNREHVEEILRASSDDLSAPEATKDVSSFIILFRVMRTETASEAISFRVYIPTRISQE